MSMMGWKSGRASDKWKQSGGILRTRIHGLSYQHNHSGACYLANKAGTRIESRVSQSDISGIKNVFPNLSGCYRGVNVGGTLRIDSLMSAGKG